MIQYGIEQTTVNKGDATVVTHTNFVNFTPTKQTTLYKESVAVDTVKDAHAAFIKLIDQHKEGAIGDFGINCVVKDGSVKRIEKTWTVTEYLR